MQMIGSIRKDCGCSNHRGPHWLWQDYETLSNNLSLLERAIHHAQDDNIQHEATAHGFRQQEQQRLLERQHHAGDYPYPYSLLGPQYADLEAHRVHLLQEYERAVKDMAERKRQAEAPTALEREGL